MSDPSETPARGTVTIEQIKAECREVLELASKATPGPWMERRQIAGPRDLFYISAGERDLLRNEYGIDMIHNATFIARTRTLTPRLARATLALIEAMEEREKSLSGSMWSFESAFTNLCATWNQ